MQLSATWQQSSWWWLTISTNIVTKSKCQTWDCCVIFFSSAYEDNLAVCTQWLHLMITCNCSPILMCAFHCSPDSTGVLCSHPAVDLQPLADANRNCSWPSLRGSLPWTSLNFAEQVLSFLIWTGPTTSAVATPSCFGGLFGQIHMRVVCARCTVVWRLKAKVCQ